MNGSQLWTGFKIGVCKCVSNKFGQNLVGSTQCVACDA